MSKGLYLKRFNTYVLAAPYNLQPGEDCSKIARARGFLSHCVELPPHKQVKLGQFKPVNGWKIVHEIGQFDNMN